MGREKVKAKFEVTLKRATKLPEKLNGSTIFIAWRRGSRKNSGISKRALVRDYVATWEEKLGFMCSFIRDKESTEWEPRGMSFAIKEDFMGKHKQSKTHSTAKINLADHVHSDGSEPVTIPLKFKKSKDVASFIITVKAHLSKVRDADVDSASDAESDGDDDISGSEGEKSEPEEEQPLTSEAEEADRGAYMRRKIEMLENELYIRGKGIRAMAEQMEENKQKMKKYKKEKEELEQLRKEMASIKGGGGGMTSSSGSTATANGTGGAVSGREAEELERLRKQMAQIKEGKSGEVIKNQEAQIKKLKQEIEDLKKAPASKSGIQRPLGNEKESKEAENVESLKQQLAKMKQDLDDTTRELASYKKRAMAAAAGNPAGSSGADRLVPPSQHQRVLSSPSLAIGSARKEELAASKETGAAMTGSGGSLAVSPRGNSGGSSPTGGGGSANNGSGSGGGSGGEKAISKEIGNGLDQEECRLLVSSILAAREVEVEGSVPAPAKRIVAALIKWQAFEKGRERTELARSIIDAIDRVNRLSFISDNFIDTQHSDNELLAFWLSATSHMLVMIRSEVGIPRGKKSFVNDFAEDLKNLITNLFQRLLTRFYDKITPVLSTAILEQPSALSQGPKCSLHSTNEVVVPILDEFLQALVASKIFPSLKRHFFSQVLTFINNTLIQSLINSKPLCTCANGFQIKLELSQLEQWVSKTLQIPELRSQLDQIAQAANVLVMDKSVLMEKEAMQQICPLLSTALVKRLLELFTPDQLAPSAVPGAVLANLEKIMAEGSSGSSSSAAQRMCTVPSPRKLVQDIDFDSLK